MNKTLITTLSILFFWQNFAISSELSSPLEVLGDGDGDEDEIKQITLPDILRLVPETEIGVSLKTLKLIFESDRRPIIGQHKYGQSFPCNPEMLYDLMSQAGRKRVLEIAGASGENALLMGLAGAEHVYMNDIVPEEVNTFRTNVESQKPELRDRFTPITGDCFDLGEHIRANSLDIILARNIFHFLKPSQYDDFFGLVKGLLKPGGIFAMTVNSRYAEYTKPIDPSEGTSFSTFLIIFDENYETPKVLARATFVCEDDTKDPLSYINHQVFNGFKIDEKTLNNLPKSLHETIKEYIKKVSQRKGKLRVLENTSMLFTPENLHVLVASAGLHVTSTHHINKKGHYISEKTAKNKGANFVGLMAQTPKDEK
ncbi:MAG TPA: hypothetical protein DD412_05640 [Holosporales bacterium]|nr:hypothetical protein [Holosporales bacterium]